MRILPEMGRVGKKSLKFYAEDRKRFNLKGKKTKNFGHFAQESAGC